MSKSVFERSPGRVVDAKNDKAGIMLLVDDDIGQIRHDIFAAFANPAYSPHLWVIDELATGSDNPGIGRL